MNKTVKREYVEERSLASKLLAMLLLSAFACTAQAATISWVSGAQGDFTTATNWVGGVVPGNLDAASARGGSDQHVIVSTDVIVGSYEMRSGTLTVEAGARLTTTGEDGTARSFNLSRNPITANISGEVYSQNSAMSLGSHLSSVTVINLDGGRLIADSGIRFGDGTTSSLTINMTNGTLMQTGFGFVEVDQNFMLNMAEGSVMRAAATNETLLATVMAQYQGWIDNSRAVITDSGSFSMFSETIEGTQYAVLSVIPEPATFAIMGLGGLLILVRRKLMLR